MDVSIPTQCRKHYSGNHGIKMSLWESTRNSTWKDVSSVNFNAFFESECFKGQYKKESFKLAKY